MPHRITLTFAIALAVTAGCSRDAAPPIATPPAAAPADRASEAQAATPLDPCALLDLASIRRAVPEAGEPVRDTLDEPYGIRACVWGTGPSQVVLQTFDAPTGAALSEIRSRSFSLVDPKSPKAATAVRIEAFSGVGDAAVAFVERVDASRGTRVAGATVLVQVGFRVVVVRAPALAALPRDEALARLKGLAQAVASSLAT